MKSLADGSLHHYLEISLLLIISKTTLCLISQQEVNMTTRPGSKSACDIYTGFASRSITSHFIWRRNINLEWSTLVDRKAKHQYLCPTTSPNQHCRLQFPSYCHRSPFLIWYFLHHGSMRRALDVRVASHLTSVQLQIGSWDTAQNILKCLANSAHWVQLLHLVGGPRKAQHWE